MKVVLKYLSKYLKHMAYFKNTKLQKNALGYEMQCTIYYKWQSFPKMFCCFFCLGWFVYSMVHWVIEFLTWATKYSKNIKIFIDDFYAKLSLF